MTREELKEFLKEHLRDKDLLINDLCSRLPYGVKFRYKYLDCFFHEKYGTSTLNGVLPPYRIIHSTLVGEDYLNIEEDEVKPYLFPLSSMTEEQTEEVHNLIYQGISESVDETSKWLKTRKENELRPITLTYILNYKLVIDWFNKNHFDYRGLIEKGLAIKAPEGMYN